jgi:hypothetical protein
MAETIQVVIIDPDGTTRNTEIEHSLGSFQAVVGGYIEGVFGRGATMYVNEEGLLQRLTPNPRATSFAERVMGRSGIFLVGTALIVGPGDGEGNDTPVRQAVVDYFKENY